MNRRRAGPCVPGALASQDSLAPSRQSAVAVVGIANMDARVLSHEEYPISTIILHEDFDEAMMTNNLALLKTDTAMQFSSLVKSICFLSAKLHVPLALQNCWVAGWQPTSAVNAFLPRGGLCVCAARGCGVMWMSCCGLISGRRVA